MAELISMGGYGVYVWSVFGLGLLTVLYNLFAARRRMRIALENAVSVAGVLLLTDATMTEIEEEADKAVEQLPQGI